MRSREYYCIEMIFTRRALIILPITRHDDTKRKETNVEMILIWRALSNLPFTRHEKKGNQ